MSRATYVMGAAAALALVAGACSRGTQQPAQNAYSYQQGRQGWQPSMSAKQLETCPMAVPGAELMVTDTPDGIALSFTTETGDVNELRSRVHKAAEQYRAQSGGNVSGSNQGTTSSGPKLASNAQQMGTSGGAGPSYSNEQPPPLDYSQGARQGRKQAEVGTNINVPFNVHAEDIDRGARLVFAPRDPRQLGMLRNQVRQHASLLQPGECPPARVSQR